MTSMFDHDHRRAPFKPIDWAAVEAAQSAELREISDAIGRHTKAMIAQFNADIERLCAWAFVFDYDLAVGPIEETLDGFRWSYMPLRARQEKPAEIAGWTIYVRPRG